jgi:hypothetical protein
VIICHAIKAFDMFYPNIEQKDKVISFVKRHCNSSREALKKESEKFLNKWN